MISTPMFRRLSLIAAYLYIPTLYSALYWPFLASQQDERAYSLPFGVAITIFIIYAVLLALIGATRRQMEILLHALGIALTLQVFEWVLSALSMPGFKRTAIENPAQFWTLALATKTGLVLTCLQLGWGVGAVARKIPRR